MRTLLTVLPVLLAMVMAIANMPTEIYQICAWNHGTERLEPWRSRLSARLIVGRLQAGIARLREWSTELASVPLFAGQAGEVSVDVLTAGAASMVHGMRLKGLRQQRADLGQELASVNSAMAKISDAISEGGKNRPMTEDERKSFNALKDKKSTLQVSIADNAEMLAAADELNARDKRPDATTVTDADAAAARRAGGILMGADRSTLDKMRGFRNPADFAMSVLRACSPGGNVDRRLAALGPATPQVAPAGYMQESGGSAGEGYEVPAQMREDIFEIVLADEGLLSAIAPEPTNSNAVDYERDETTPWGTSGVQAYWRSEAAQMQASKQGTNLATSRLHELYAFVLATGELLADAPRLSNRLINKAGLAIRWKAEEALMFGDGVGKPLGWMNSQALVTVAKESGQAANTVNVANLANLFSRTILMGGKLFWALNPSTLSQILQLTIGNMPVFVPTGTGLTGQPAGSILGLPIRYSDHCAALSAVGDVQLINPNGYLANIKANDSGGLEFASSLHLYFDYNVNAFRWIFRLGGQPFMSAPMSPAKGSATRSHFTALGAR